MNDGSDTHYLSNAINSTITISSVNDAIALNESSTTTYTENADAIEINNAITLSNIENTPLISATVSITNFVPDEDVLSFTSNTNTGNIIASFNSNTGVLKLTSLDNSATTSQFEAALRAVKYSNLSDNPTTSSRDIAFRAISADMNNSCSNAVHSTLEIIGVNDEPIVVAHSVGGNFIEGVNNSIGTAVKLFDDTVISTIESGQFITNLTFQVRNVSDEMNEQIFINGSYIGLKNNRVGVTLDHGFLYQVSVTGNITSVKLTMQDNITPSILASQINNMSYRNISTDPTAGNRENPFNSNY